MMLTGYLAQQEKEDTIPLWKEAFPEDGPEFLAYYYREKTKDNRILAAWEGEKDSRRIISMVQRNPYKLWLKGCVADSDYIVAVATVKDKRHQGLMRMLMTGMMEDMHREGMPFCYLMPANRKIYEPFGFAYIYDQEHWAVPEETERRLIKEKVGPEDSGEAARWMEEWLEQEYEVFAVRDKAYVERLLAELESEKGQMGFLCDQGRTVGIRCWWGIKEREQRMLLCGRKYREDKKEKTPAIMARITDLEKCLGLMRLKKDSPFDRLEVVLSVEDSLCPWNNGVFLWTIGKEKSRAVKTEARTGLGDQTGKIGIHLLTQWLFGYKSLEEVGCGQQESGIKKKASTPAGEGTPWWQEIDLWKKVFLDEIV